jgi:DNA repair protein RecN (Recombination protein N)
MLQELRIKNLAIIDNLSVVFGPGLNIFTGETGAGKSIIIDAISLILGDRASNDMIRTSADEAEVEALFDLSGASAPLRGIKAVLDEAGIAQSESLIIKRVINKSGRNRIYINGSLATLVTLTEVGRRLIDICGQSEHQSLTRPEEHIEALDSFGGFLKLREDMAGAYKAYYSLKKGHEALIHDAGGLASRRETLAFQSKEIEDAALRPGMEAELLKEKERLKGAEKIKAAAMNADKIIYSDTGSAVERLGAVVKSLKEVSGLDDKIAKSLQAIEASVYQLEDAGTFLRDYARSVESDPQALDELGEKLDKISRLKKKDGATVEAILEKKAEFDSQLAGLVNYEERLKVMEASLKQARELAEEVSSKLTAKRVEAAKSFKGKIEDELKSLAMKGTVFEVRLETDKNHDGAPRLGEKGVDRVSFYISPNPGEELRPLAKIASGGELSRLMLSMKKAATAGRVSTLVFDEIDAGIGGSAAQAVGLKLKEVSAGHQVICITHLPQIAAFADTHFAVVKQTAQGGRTTTSVRQLKEDEITGHIADMLGGVKVTDVTRKHASELIELAGKLTKKKQ